MNSYSVLKIWRGLPLWACARDRDRRRSAGTARADWKRLRLAARIFLALLPTLTAATYFGVVATDRYVSEARFVIRTASKPANLLNGLSTLLQFAGISPAQDDAHAVHDFLTSRDALTQLADQINLREVYNPPGADFVARYPSIFYGPSNEELYHYFQRMLTVVVDHNSGLTTLRIQAFRATDAQRLTRTLLDLGEGLVNRLNVRIQTDALRIATAEMTRAQERRVASQLAITAFRDRERTLDPGTISAIVVELIGQLSAQLSEVNMQIVETTGNSPHSPQLQTLRQRAAAIDRQIGLERARVASTSDRLASQVAEYERLMLERDFSIRMLEQTVTGLEAARIEARRQQLFLERVVEPGLPDAAMEPRRWRTICVVFGFNVIGLAVLWLIGTGFREHASAAR